MDEEFEKPGTRVTVDGNAGDEGQSSGDEDDALDWSKLVASSLDRPVIPKRGEKDFQPKEGSNLQAHNLDCARNAMFGVLKSMKAVSSKNASYGIWLPDLSRARISQARGIHFNTMGHSANRQISPSKWAKQLELLPEEALYLIERGTLFCTRVLSSHNVVEQLPPMSIQEAYATMIGKEELTLEKYHVYAYLKRLGYAVTRYKPPINSPYYPLPVPYLPNVATTSVSGKLVNIFDKLLQCFRRATFRWWKPISLRWNHSSSSILKSLLFIRSGFGYSIGPPPEATPYQIFFNIYKPSTPFRKTAPPPPDFQCVVVNASITVIPSLSELSELFSQVPEKDLPLPRRRQPSSSPPLRENPKTWYNRIFSYITMSPKPKEQQPRQAHPFALLKAGKKHIIIAAVDNGNISFFRFGQGCFEEMPMR